MPQSHIQGNACFLNYVNEDVQDIWMCQYSGRSVYSSMLVQTLMSGTSYTAVCSVDLDRGTDQMIDEICSQVSLIKAVIANTRDLRTDIIICGISSFKQPQQQTMNTIHQQAKKMISESTRIDIADSMSICLPTSSPEEELSPLIETLKKISKAIPQNETWISVFVETPVERFQ